MISIKKHYDSKIVTLHDVSTHFIGGYEVIKDTPVKAYCDIDIYQDEDSKVSVYRNIKSIFEGHNYSLFCANRMDPEKSYKHSYHIILHDKIYHCGLCVKNVMKELFKNKLIQPDWSVYKSVDKMQLFRLPYTHKEKDTTVDDVFKLIDLKNNDSLTVYSRSTKKYLKYYLTLNKSITEPLTCLKEIVQRSLPKTLDEFKNISKQQLYTLVMSLPIELADGRESWLKVLWAIKDTADKNGYDALDIADEFSKQSEKYKGLEDVEKVYNESNGSITYGTLVHYSVKNKSINETLLSDLKQLSSLETLSKLSDMKLSKNHINLKSLMENGSNNELMIANNNLLVSQVKEILGYCHPQVTITGDLTLIDSEFHTTSICHLIDIDTVDIISQTTLGGEHKIHCKYPWDYKRFYAALYINGKRVKMITNKQSKDTILDAIGKGSYELLKSRYNINININNGIINNYFGGENESVRSEEQFVVDLIKVNPDIINNFKATTGKECHVYRCHDDSKIWKRIVINEIEKQLSIFLKNHLDLNDKEIKAVETQSKIQSLRIMFYKQILDDEFEKKIDENQDIFALDNYVFDKTTKSLRESTPQDYILSNSGWSYLKEDSEKYINDLQNYLKKIFPIEEEKLIVLTEIASLLHGYRISKRFMIFTDKRDGNNGKTTFLALLEKFFGDYYYVNNNYFNKQSSFKDKDSHGGGTVPLKGKRLLVADDVKKFKHLDEELLKNATGGNYKGTGRFVGKEDFIKFKWQAGLIMVFNEGDCPRFDPSDSALIQRMIICPFRSKFLPNIEDNEETLTYTIDNDILTKLDLWRSSFLNLLISLLEKDSSIIPESMKEWKNDIVNENNELNEWFLKTVDLNGNYDDVLSLNILFIEYKACNEYKGMTETKFKQFAKGWFKNNGKEVIERLRYRQDNHQKEVRNGIRGVKLLS